MQHLTHNILQHAWSGGAPTEILGFPSHSEHSGFTNSKTLEDPGICTDKLPSIVPDSVGLLDDQFLPFLWKNETGYVGPGIVPVNTWCSSNALPSSETSEFFLEAGSTDDNMEDFRWGGSELMYQGENLSSEVYQELPTLSQTLLDIPRTGGVQKNSHAPSTPGLERSCSTLTARQKIAHSQSERRYRRNLDATFLQLEDALSPCHSEDGKFSSRSSKRVRRVKLLGMARQTILELEKELKSTRKKLQILREATLPPEALKFTLEDDSV